MVPALMALHTLFTSDIPDVGELLVIEGDEAKHAVRSKRIEPGDFVKLTNGWGAVAEAEVREAGRSLSLMIRTIDTVDPIRPEVRVFAATPKGPRLDKMIDALSQVGARSWSPMSTRFGVVDPGSNKMDRSCRIALESAKQCGRAWVMEIGKKTDFVRAIQGLRGGCAVIADAGGEAYTASGADEIALFVGPEGGWSEDELAAARTAGARVCSFGVHTMRIETATPVAAACIIDHERRGQSK